MQVKAEQILSDFERSYRYLAPIHKCMLEDFEYEAGKQWKQEDVNVLKEAGVKALTINKLRPIIKLITGIERQSKSDYIAFPEGNEDGLVADITTGLLKNVVKQSKAERKLSVQFKRGCIGGMDFVQPYVDYTYDMVNGELFIRNLNPLKVFFDPDAEEYDLSDGKFMIKLTTGLTKEQLITLFPTKSAKINQIKNGKISVDSLTSTDEHEQKRDYPSINEDNDNTVTDNEGDFDLIDYEYKSMIKKYFIIEKSLNLVQEVDDKEAGIEYVQLHPEAKLIEKMVPEIRCAYLVGKEIIHDEVAWFYPKWKNWSIISFFADRLTMPLDKQELNIQGIVRNLKDLQEEYNKRRTQELRHLNASVNSGMMAADDALSPQELDKIKKHGSSPGIFITYKKDTVGKPERIPPMPLSSAHAQLAVENAQDLKEASGVNPDLLANADTSQSGRAILLKQKQGLVMIQEYLDNYSETKRNLGRFLLTQLGEVYTVETAIKVLGNDFLLKYKEFNKPSIDEAGQPVVEGGQLKTEIDEEAVMSIFNSVLNEASDISKYDVSIGEGAYNETMKMSNYLMLADMAKNGIPIPPDVLINESMLPQGAKQKIIASIEATQMAMSQGKPGGM